jgi:predicted RNA binding protein YcfA (HicA-like mRNA interferase family)
VPVLKPREVIAILTRFGFAEVRQRGSHKQFRSRSPLVRRLSATNVRTLESCKQGRAMLMPRRVADQLVKRFPDTVERRAAIWTGLRLK